MVRSRTSLLAATVVALAAWSVASPGSDGSGMVEMPATVSASDGSDSAEATDDEGETSGETSSAAPAGMTAEEVARRIQQFYRETEDFEAEFRQVYTDVAAGEEKTHHGRVYFKKPGKMRWDYYESSSREERNKTLVSDGELFWIYELEFQQVFKKCLENSQLPTSLKFLMGKGNLVEDFDVTFTDASAPDAPELELVPVEPTPKYEKLHFRVDPESFRVERTTVFDPYGNTNVLDFQSTRLNQNLPDSGFDFEPPDSARLLNAEKECE